MMVFPICTVKKGIIVFHKLELFMEIFETKTYISLE